MPVNAINGIAFSTLSAVNGKTLSGLTAINGQTIGIGSLPVTDTFNRADSASSLGTASDGVHTWTARTGTWGISSNQAYSPSIGSGPGYTGSVATINAGTGNGWLRIALPTMRTTADDAGVVFRYTDTSNFWIAQYSFTSVQVKIVKIEAGSLSLVASASFAAATAADGERLMVELNGTSIKLYIEDQLLISTTSSFNLTASDHGLFTQQTGTRLDDLSMTVSDPTPSLTTIVSDTFNRADSSSSMGTADTGQVWVALQHTWGIDTNRAYDTSASSDGTCYVESSNADCTIQVTLTTFGSKAGFTFRVQDLNNHYIIRMQSGTNDVVCFRRQGGTYNAQGNNSISAPANGDVIKMVLRGSLAMFFMNGVLKLAFSNSTFSTETKHGLHTLSDNTSRFDTFTIKI